MDNAPDIRLIAFDLDGTALTSEKKFSPRTRAAIDRAVRKGILIVPSTGRSLETIPPDILQIPGLSYIITENGTRIFSRTEGKYIFSRFFEKKTGLSLLTDCRAFPAMIYGSYDEQGAIDTKGRGWEDADIRNMIRLHRETWKTPAVDLESILLNSQKLCNKLTIIFTDFAERNRAFDHFTAHQDAHVTCFAKDNVELIPRGTNKGIALEIVAERAGLETEKVMAIGDNYNDLEMIQAAGIGVAMSNGVEELRQAADRVTLSCDEDGAALAIESVL
jgi:Cof subfamily protein (haloacid dehalogenase superfamily)